MHSNGVSAILRAWWPNALADVIQNWELRICIAAAVCAPFYIIMPAARSTTLATASKSVAIFSLSAAPRELLSLELLLVRRSQPLVSQIQRNNTRAPCDNQSTFTFQLAEFTLLLSLVTCVHFNYWRKHRDYWVWNFPPCCCQRATQKQTNKAKSFLCVWVLVGWIGWITIIFSHLFWLCFLAYKLNL